MKTNFLLGAMLLLACGSPMNGGGAGGGVASGTGGGTGATGGGAGGGTSSTFDGDACDKQRIVALTAQGTDFTGSAISDNSIATPSITPTCAPKSRDVVFKLELPQAGALHLKVTPHGATSTAHFDPVITVFTGASCVAATELACSDSGAIDADETLIRQMAAGPVWVWVSSADPTETGGEFELEVLLD